MGPWGQGPMSFVVGPGTLSFVVGPGTLRFVVGPGTLSFVVGPGGWGGVGIVIAQVRAPGRKIKISILILRPGFWPLGPGP